MRLRHSDDTLLEGFVSCKSPIAAPIGSHRITYWAWTYRRRQRCVTNVVNLRPKTTIFRKNAVGLTTFVTTRAEPDNSDRAPLVRRAPEGPEG